jgi:SAM-dependent methyltransferase
MDAPGQGASDIQQRVRDLLRYEPDVAFRRRAATVLGFIDPAPGDRILDNGCGLGFYLHLLCRLSRAEVWGIERDQVRLRTAGRDPEASRARLVQGDVTALPFASASFDKVVCSEVLEHLDDDARGASEMARVLKPGGVCAVTVPHTGYPVTWDPPNYLRERLGLGHFVSGPLSGIWTDHRRLYSPEALRAVMESADLSVTDCRLETRHAFPFSHFLVYELGRRLMERGLAPRGSQGPGGRSALWSEDRRLTPLRLLTRWFTSVDRLNRDTYESGPAVSLCMRAVKRAPSAEGAG